MRTVKEVTIKNAIAHSLDNSIDSSRLSDYELDLDEKVVSFIRTHVLKSLEDEKIRAAKYEAGRNIVKESADSIFDFPEKFLEESKEIARQLFLAMQSNKNITSADLIVSLYEGNGQNYLAVLKMDYQSTYITESKVISGKTKIVLTDKGISLPNIRQKLQKCVFFKRSITEDADVETANNTYDMLLIDRQARQESERDIAQYFATTFLKCKLVLNDKDRTKKFHLKVKKYVNEFLADQPEEQKRVLDSLEVTLRNQQHVSAVEFSNNHFSEEQRQLFLDFLVNEGLSDFEFVPDKEYVQAKYKIRKIRTNEKIEVSLLDDDYKNPEKFSYEPVEGGRYNLTIKSVKVTDWGG